MGGSVTTAGVMVAEEEEEEEEDTVVVVPTAAASRCKGLGFFTFMRMRSMSSEGEGSLSADRSRGSVTRRGPKVAFIIAAMMACCGGLQWTSREIHSGNRVSWKAYLFIVVMTSWKLIDEVKVRPWLTSGWPFGPSQQSTSMQRQPRVKA